VELSFFRIAMKKISLILLAFFAIFSQTVFAQESVSAKTNPREHRGFYNSASFGAGFLGLSVKRLDYVGRERFDERQVEKFEFIGGSFPVFEFKFGTAVANLVAFHTVFNFAIFTGSDDYFYDEYRKSFQYDDAKYKPVLDKDGNNIYTSGWVKEKSESEESSGTAVNVRSYLGFGATLYPFRDPGSVMNGAFVGASMGYTFFGTATKADDNSAYGSLGTGFQVELGKDWWLNDHLSVGVGLTYGHSFLNFFGTEGSDNLISLNFRLTRG